jgi:hypothetical protein
MPPADIRTAAFNFSKAAVLGHDKLCCMTAFFLLPSCGSFSNIGYKSVSQSGITAKN